MARGFFIGKGIYDLHVFQSVLENAIPDNTVLSHDLLEGSYVRTGLLTDLRLVDSFPAQYHSFAAQDAPMGQGGLAAVSLLFQDQVPRQYEIRIR